MARFKDDSLFLRRGSGTGSRRSVRPILLLLLFISLGLLLLSRLNHSSLADARWRVAAFFAPLLQAATIPAEPLRDLAHAISAQFQLTTELERLRNENQKLSNWQWRAKQLEGQLADLEALAKVVPEQRLDFVTGRVIADSSGAFVRSAMINAGKKQKIKTGYPVINADGLVGRIVNVGSDSARVLLLSDLSSRVPVVVGPESLRAILAGDNGAAPRLLYLTDGAKVAIGDDVSTSGTGGLFPSGLRIGTVTSVGGEPRISVRANLDNLEFLSVLFFEDPSRVLTGDISRDAVRTPVRAGAGTTSAPSRRPN